MYLLFDIGGSKTRIALGEGEEILGEPIVYPTPQNFEEGIEKMIFSSQELIGEEDLDDIIGGIAGPIDETTGILKNSPNLPNWVNGNIKERLEKALGAQVTLKNDAALGALGEASFGAGRGSSIVAYLTVSTGLGGARIVDLEIDRSFLGFEPGFQIIASEEGRERAIELVSGRSVKQRFGLNPEEIDDEKVWDELAENLARVVNNIIALWSPEVLVLGGSMILGPKCIDLEKMAGKLGEMMTIFPELPTIKKAELGDFSGLYGALAYSKIK